MLTNVQVAPGTTWVARFGDVVAWFETAPGGGGVTLTQLLQALQGVAVGSTPSRQLGARLAAVLNTGEAGAVPALAAATPEGDGLRVVVHGWGAVVADGVHVPNGWVDQVVDDRRTFFLGRNTVTPVAPDLASTLDLEDGVVPGDGVSFALSAPAPAGASLGAEPPAYEPPPSDPPPPAPVPSPPPQPLAWPPPGGGQPEPVGMPPVQPAPASYPAPAATPPAAPPPSAGRLVLDDGSSAVLERTSVLGSVPYDSPAVQTGVAIPLAVFGDGVAPVHAEVRVEQGQVSVRDLGAAATYLLLPGTPTWALLGAGQISPLIPGTRIALGQRTLSYERP